MSTQNKNNIKFKYHRSSDKITFFYSENKTLPACLLAFGSELAGSPFNFMGEPNGCVDFLLPGANWMTTKR